MCEATEAAATTSASLSCHDGACGPQHACHAAMQVRTYEQAAQLTPMLIMRSSTTTAPRHATCRAVSPHLDLLRQDALLCMQCGIAVVGLRPKPRPGAAAWAAGLHAACQECAHSERRAVEAELVMECGGYEFRSHLFQKSAPRLRTELSYTDWAAKIRNNAGRLQKEWALHV